MLITANAFGGPVAINMNLDNDGNLEVTGSFPLNHRNEFLHLIRGKLFTGSIVIKYSRFNKKFYWLHETLGRYEHGKTITQGMRDSIQKWLEAETMKILESDNRLYAKLKQGKIRGEIWELKKEINTLEEAKKQAQQKIEDLEEQLKRGI